MQLYNMVIKQIKLMLSNRMALLAILAAPLLLTYLFTFTGDEVQIRVYIADQDQSAYSKQLGDFFRTDPNYEVVSLSESALREQLLEHHEAAGVVIEPGFGTEGPSDIPSHLQVVLEQSRSNQEVEYAVTGKIQIFLDGGDAVQHKEPSVHPDLTTNDNAAANKSDIIGSKLSGFMLMFLWFAVIQGFRTLMDERENGLERRLLMLPVPFVKYLWSKLIAAYLFSLFVVVLILMASTWFLDMPFWDGLGVRCLIWSAYTLAITGLVLLLVPWIRSHQNFTVSGSVIIAVAGILGGSFFPIEDRFPAWFRWLSEVIPGTWALRALNAASLNESSFLSVIEIVGGLYGVGMICIGLSFLLMKHSLKKQMQNG